MGSTEVAGVVAASNWNNANGISSSSAQSLVDQNGNVTGATVMWKADNLQSLNLADQPGNVRMINGYLDDHSGNPTTVAVSGLPSNGSGYAVYVYADGHNLSGTRAGNYQISGTGIPTTNIGLIDAANTDYNGTFTQANNSNGNYVVFTINAAAFTLTVTPTTASDGTLRAPVNAIQIVSQGGSGSPTAPTITAHPTNQTVTAGQSAKFSVAASGTNPLNYQWQKNGAPISGATGATYVIPSTAPLDNGATFCAHVSNSAGNATSQTATLIVNSDTTPPSVSITSPTSGATISGTSMVTASASDDGAVASVQLQVDGANVGLADTTSPYSFSLDSTALSNGSHILTAVATDASGYQTTSALVSIMVSNQAGGAPMDPTYANNGSGCPINTVAGGPTDSVGSYNCPLPNPTGAGNLLAIFLRYVDSNHPTVSFTDNIGGNVYTQAVACLDAGYATQSRMYYVQNVAAGVSLITAHFSASTTRVQMGVYEFYNVATSSALDSANCQVSSGSSISSGPLSSLSSGDLVMQFGHADNSVAIGSCAVGSQSNITWTMRSALIASNEPMCAQYGIYNSTVSFSPTMTFDRNVNYISLAAAFKAASAGTAPPSGIRVAYVQHDNGGSLTATSIGLELPISGNLAVEMVITSCGSSTLNSCNYATSVSDGTNNWSQIGSTYLSNTGSPQEEPAQIWYAKNAIPGLYKLSNTENPSSSRAQTPFPLTWMLYDIVGASSNPLDLGFGGNGNGLATFSSVNSSGPVTTFTVTPSAPNELIITGVGYEWNTFTGVTSPTGANFISCDYTNETNYSWVDSNGGYAILYNGNSTAPETWTWPHDTSQQAGSGRGLAIGAAFQ